MFPKEFIIQCNRERIDSLKEYMNERGALVDIAIGMTMSGKRTGQVIIQILNDQIDQETLTRILKDCAYVVEHDKFEKCHAKPRDPEVN